MVGVPIADFVTCETKIILELRVLSICCSVAGLGLGLFFALGGELSRRLGFGLAPPLRLALRLTLC